MSQWLQDVHVASGVTLLTLINQRDAPHPSPASLRCSRGSGTIKREQLSVRNSSDRLTPLIGWQVMGLALSVQWAARASGVMLRLNGLSAKRGLWLVHFISERETVPAQWNYNPIEDWHLLAAITRLWPCHYRYNTKFFILFKMFFLFQSYCYFLIPSFAHLHSQ